MTSKNTLRGIGLVIAAMAILPLIDVCAKVLGQQGVPVAQTTWVRMALSAMLTLPFVLRETTLSSLWPDRPLLHTLRGGMLAGVTFFFFMGLKYLPIADMVAIYFVQPLMIVALSVLVLGEKVGVQRWLAVIIGLIGVLIIIRPGLQELNPGVMYALLSGLCYAIYAILTRRMRGQASAMMMTFHSNLMCAIVLLPILPFIWQSATVTQWQLLFLIGAISVSGHYMITRAYGLAEASLLAPLAYTEMIMAVILGWYFFGDFPDRWTFLGVSILIGCALFISWRERVKAGAAVQQ